jgi:CheY-like chemotaxis protein
LVQTGDESAAGSHAGGTAKQALKARVLIVEDDVDAAEALATLLQLFGHIADVAHDGSAALAALDRVRPDVMLVDIGLPDIDGFEVARRARLLPAGEKTLLVALSGYGQDSDKQRAREAGFDHHLTKPIEIDALRVVVGS